MVGVFLYGLTGLSLSSVISSSSFMQSLPVTKTMQALTASWVILLPSCHDVLKMASTKASVLTVDSSDNSDSSRKCS